MAGHSHRHSTLAKILEACPLKLWLRKFRQFTIYPFILISLSLITIESSLSSCHYSNWMTPLTEEIPKFEQLPDYVLVA